MFLKEFKRISGAPCVLFLRWFDTPGYTWFTSNLRRLKILKQRAWNRYRKSGLLLHRQYYCQLRNFYNLALKREKQSFLAFNFKNNCKKNPKLFWSNLRKWNFVAPTARDSIPPDLFSADTVNNFFIDSIPKTTASPQFRNYFKRATFSNSNKPKFIYSPVEVEKIAKVTLKLKSSLTGYDGISARMLQLSLPFICNQLTHIINFSFEQGLVPNLWKISNVTPIPKRSKVDCLNDLRPISIQPVLLLIAETVIYEQFSDYISTLNILPKVQSGFRKNYSTATALLSITDDILRNTDARRITSLTLLDLSKAFDSLDINCLVEKLAYYGVGDLTLEWFQSYLNNRHQLCRINFNTYQEISSLRKVESGVPQGSILGPLLFSIFISDIQFVPRYCKIHLYADDIQIYFSFDPQDEEFALQKVNLDLEEI